MSVIRPESAGARLAARAERFATARNARLAMGAAAVIALAILAGRPTYPNYDTYYTLIWGDELARGHLPDYDVFRTPTPHPLSTLVAALFSFLGGAADRAMVFLTVGSFVALVALLFRLTQLLVGTLAACAAVLVLLTRTDIEFFALRGVVDVPFLALVFGAAVLEASRPRSGAPVILLLTLAGLLRPEAWMLAGAYVLYLAWRADPPERMGVLIRQGALAASAPVLWVLSDWAVTGEPLYSLTSTREVAGDFGRQRGIIDAIGLIPDYVGANEKIVNVAAGGLGGLLALWLIRVRAALPLALVAVGFATFLAIAVAGLSVIPRYLVIPSLVLNLCVAVALTGWALVTEPRARRAALALAGLTVALYMVRTPALVNDFRKLNGQTTFVKSQHQDLKAVLEDAAVVPLLASCRPITTPTHSAIPVIRFETGLPKSAFEPSIAQKRPPTRGLLFVGETFNFEPAAARSTTGVGERSAAQWWSNYPLSTFRPVVRKGRWAVYENCA
ncbi:MAG TPA: hypothetical protein VNT32_13630 [Thermoleophilaceae bacterium]|nr:hypothetical protein [Thermoleophilaceae bacterium]